MPESPISERYGGGYLLSKHSSLICDGCGENFDRPILATVVSGNFSRTYYACPRCLTKVGEIESAKHDKSDEEDKGSTAIARKKMESDSEETRCEHFLGYLRKRPKNTPIPDDCLTCSRMIECLTYQA